MEDIIMDITKGQKTTFNFINVETRIKLIDANSTNIYFINAVNARQVYNELKNSGTFDNHNEVCVEDTHTLSITGEVDIHYNKNSKILTIIAFS